jgi:MoaA/NifB/PqqE/SkfB family radical SAM enzyme
VCERLGVQSEDHPDVIVGNVIRTGICEVWNSSKLEQPTIPAQQHFDASACGTCTEFAQCTPERGRCLVRALAATDGLLAPDPLCTRMLLKWTRTCYTCRPCKTWACWFILDRAAPTTR